jgi:hypothetical protein
LLAVGIVPFKLSNAAEIFDAIDSNGRIVAVAKAKFQQGLPGQQTTI